MMKLRMRTKFLLSMLLISTGLTCTSLLLVRQRVKATKPRKSLPICRIRFTPFRTFSRNANAL